MTMLRLDVFWELLVADLSEVSSPELVAEQ